MCKINAQIEKQPRIYNPCNIERKNTGYAASSTIRGSQCMKLNKLFIWISCFIVQNSYKYFIFIKQHGIGNGWF